MAGLTFNDTSGKAGLIQDCEFLLNLGDAGISGDASSAALLKVFTRLINSWYQKVITMIFASQDDWDWDDINQTDYPIATTNLVANQQDYSFPVSLNILKIQRVDISFDGGTTWKRCNPLDKGESIQPIEAANVRDNFSIANPFYDIQYGSLFIYPIPTANSTAGLKIWFLRSPLEFASTDTTKAPGIDYAFHRMLSIGACLEYATIKSLPQRDMLAQMLVDYEQRLRLHYGRKNEDTSVNLVPIYNDTYGS